MARGKLPLKVVKKITSGKNIRKSGSTIKDWRRSQLSRSGGKQNKRYYKRFWAKDKTIEKPND